MRSDLISIATTERRYYMRRRWKIRLPFDELISSNYLTIARQRPPYTYEIQTSSGGFRAVATRSGDDASCTPAQLSVDEKHGFPDIPVVPLGQWVIVPGSAPPGHLGAPQGLPEFILKSGFIQFVEWKSAVNAVSSSIQRLAGRLLQ